MTSLFDTAVRNRKHHTPWTEIDAFRFMRDMAMNGAGTAAENAVKISVQYRRDVASRFWWTIEWTGADGERHEQTAQDLDLLLWRAAEAELQIEAKLNAEGKSGGDHVAE